MIIPEPTTIDGGWHVKTSDDGTFCIDVLKMAFNYRVVKSPISESGLNHIVTSAGYCYFGHGIDEAGNPRTMGMAKLAAISAATIWDGHGHPLGFDKQAF